MNTINYLAPVLVPTWLIWVLLGFGSGTPIYAPKPGPCNPSGVTGCIVAGPGTLNPGTMPKGSGAGQP